MSAVNFSLGTLLTYQIKKKETVFIVEQHNLGLFLQCSP